ncbi:MAG: glycosyl hydrolase family 95 catalytic domain-containing protein [Lachnospiraceae bacterium]
MDEIPYELLTILKPAGYGERRKRFWTKKLMESFPKLKSESMVSRRNGWIKIMKRWSRHRHISHLYGMYPGTGDNQTDAELMKAVRHAERRSPTEALHRWSRAWITGRGQGSERERKIQKTSGACQSIF